MTALPDLKVLNKMNETMLIGAQKVVDPPLQMEDDGVILPLVTRPGGINYRRAGSDPIRPIFNDTRIDFGYQALEDRRKRVRDAFFVDQLRLSMDQKYMTATEVLQRTEEAMRLLGPVLGRLQEEFLRPIVDRLFNIMYKRGLIDPAPPELVGMKLDVKYSSLIAKSQRLSDGQNIVRTIQTISPFLQIDPAASDNINADNAIRIVTQVYGAPQELIRTKAEIEKIRQGRAEAQAAQAQAMQQQAEVDNSAKIVETMNAMGAQGG